MGPEWLYGLAIERVRPMGPGSCLVRLIFLPLSKAILSYDNLQYLTLIQKLSTLDHHVSI